ncbi:hypothetical protein ACWFRB_09465 [Rhodococcus sp. NPDC055112]
MSALEELVREYLADLVEELGAPAGHRKWTVASAERHARAGRDGRPTIYVEVVLPEDTVQAYAVAHPLPQQDPPAFDDGAAADRAHDAAVDEANGVL